MYPGAHKYSVTPNASTPNAAKSRPSRLAATQRAALTLQTRRQKTEGARDAEADVVENRRIGEGSASRTQP
jgi:hypothetical protein